jgi:hypothetical protein
VVGLRLALKHATSGRPGSAAMMMHSGSIVEEVDV